jgi:hypothetical protein
LQVVARYGVFFYKNFFLKYYRFILKVFGRKVETRLRENVLMLCSENGCCNFCSDVCNVTAS